MYATMPFAAPPVEMPQDHGLLLDQAYKIALPYGEVVPLYQVDSMGRREQTPVRLYKDGTLRSLPLQERTLVHTPAGIFPAEHLTFYPGGELRRLFPSAGKLSGFWSEEMEYAQAPLCEFKVGSCRCKARPISIQFYPGGAIQSVTLWPEERVVLCTPQGEIEARTGLSLFPDGRLQSLEPAAPVEVQTPIGPMLAYDNDPLGLVADRNSLAWNQLGSIASLKTLGSAVKVFPIDSEPVLFTPTRLSGYCGEAGAAWKPLVLSFAEEHVVFESDGNVVSYAQASTFFEIIPFAASQQGAWGCG